MIKFTYARTIFAAVIAWLPLVMQAQVIQINIKNNAVDYERLSKITRLSSTKVMAIPMWHQKNQ